MPRRKTTRRSRRKPKEEGVEGNEGGGGLQGGEGAPERFLQRQSRLSRGNQEDGQSKLSRISPSEKELEKKIDAIGEQLASLEQRLSADMAALCSLLEAATGQPGLSQQRLAPNALRPPPSSTSPEPAQAVRSASQQSGFVQLPSLPPAGLSGPPPAPSSSSPAAQPPTTNEAPARPPMLHRRLFPSSDSSSQYEEDSSLLKPQDSLRSDGGTTESEFRSALSSTAQAPIARLESMDELETSQERISRMPSKESRGEEGDLASVQSSQSQRFFSEKLAILVKAAALPLLEY